MEEYDAYILASAAQYLVEGQELSAADILLLCSNLLKTDGRSSYSNGSLVTDVEIMLWGNRTICDIINDKEHDLTKSIFKAFQAALGPE